MRKQYKGENDLNIQYFMPTKLLMGIQCIKNNPALFSELGKKALIVTGAHSAKANGSLDDVLAVLEANGQQYALFDKVMCNPTVACVYEGAAFAKQEKADFVIAIGGGSPMDAAKAIALLACQQIPEEELFLGHYTSEVLPMAFVPTTAGTGSEVTPYSVLTNEKLQTKTSISSPALFPKYAFLDASYMTGLSDKTTVNTALDALSHSIEGMLSTRANAVTDLLASESIRQIATCFTALQAQALTLAQREALLYASLLGGMVIANTGTTVVHPMGYSLTYFKDIDHGRANGLLLAAFLECLKKSIPARINEIIFLMNFNTVSDFKAVLDSLLGEKETLTADEINQYAEKASKSKNLSNCLTVLTQADLQKVYRDSFGL